jgi:hypothetical protein
MIGVGFGGRRAVRGIGLLVVALCCSAAVATAAPAATLSVKVKPARIHQSKMFDISITFSYTRSELKGTAWLIAFDQFNDTSPCNREASKEAKKPSAKQGRFADQAAGKTGGWDFKFKAGGVGSRRVCAYLFAKKDTRGTGTPLRRATTTFRVTR